MNIPAEGIYPCTGAHRKYSRGRQSFFSFLLYLPVNCLLVFLYFSLFQFSCLLAQPGLLIKARTQSSERSQREMFCPSMVFPSHNFSRGIRVRSGLAGWLKTSSRRVHVPLRGFERAGVKRIERKLNNRICILPDNTTSTSAPS